MPAEKVLEDREWKCFFTFRPAFDIVVYYYQAQEGSWPSFVFLCRPPCFMANTTIGTKITQLLIRAMQKRAMEFYIIYLICKKLREKNASSFETERDLGKYSIFGNILFAHALFVHFVCNLDIGLLYAVLAFKNFLLDMTCNAFDKQYHGLDIPNGNYHVVASNLRRQMAQAATRITTRTNDNQFHITVLNRLGRCLSEPTTPRFISGAVDILKLVNGRITLFVAKKLLNAQTNQLLLDEYRSRIDPRRGDRTTQAVLANDVSYERFVSGGVWTLCQATGKAGSVVFSDIPTNTVLGEFELDGVLRPKRSPSRKFSPLQYDFWCSAFTNQKA